MKGFTEEENKTIDRMAIMLDSKEKLVAFMKYIVKLERELKKRKAIDSGKKCHSRYLTNVKVK